MVYDCRAEWCSSAIYTCKMLEKRRIDDDRIDDDDNDDSNSNSNSNSNFFFLSLDDRLNHTSHYSVKQNLWSEHLRGLHVTASTPQSPSDTQV